MMSSHQCLNAARKSLEAQDEVQILMQVSANIVTYATPCARMSCFLAAWTKYIKLTAISHPTSICYKFITSSEPFLIMCATSVEQLMGFLYKIRFHGLLLGWQRSFWDGAHFDITAYQILPTHWPHPMRYGLFDSELHDRLWVTQHLNFTMSWSCLIFINK